MARKRMEEPALKSWEEVDGTLKKIREAEIALTDISTAAEKMILDIKQQAEEDAQQYKDKIKQYELQVKEYTTIHRDEMLPAKSKEMAFGQVGFRMSTKVMLPKKLDRVIAKLKKLGMGDCIITNETVDRNILKTYDEKTILEVGGTLKKSDAFWYETKQEKIADPA